MWVLIADVVAAPYGMPAIRPDAHFMFIHFAIPLLKNGGEGGEVSVNGLKVTVSDFVPLGFQRGREMTHKNTDERLPVGAVGEAVLRCGMTRSAPSGRSPEAFLK